MRSATDISDFTTMHEDTMPFIDAAVLNGGLCAVLPIGYATTAAVAKAMGYKVRPLRIQDGMMIMLVSSERTS